MKVNEHESKPHTETPKKRGYGSMCKATRLSKVWHCHRTVNHTMTHTTAILRKLKMCGFHHGNMSTAFTFASYMPDWIL